MSALIIFMSALIIQNGDVRTERVPRLTRRTPAPGRRQQHKAATRTRIVEAALELFQSRGFAATTTKSIAKKARIAEGTVFNYFPTKEDHRHAPAFAFSAPYARSSSSRLKRGNPRSESLCDFDSAATRREDVRDLHEIGNPMRGVIAYARMKA